MIAPAKARADAEVLPLRFRDRLDHRAIAGRIRGHRLFEKAVFSRGHRGFEMKRTKRRRRRAQHHIHAAVDDFLIRIEPDELPLLRHVHLVGMRLRQALEAGHDLVFESIAHRPQHAVAIGGQRLIRRAAAATAAADEADLDFARRRRAGEDRREAERGDGGGGVLEEVTTGAVGVCGVHDEGGVRVGELLRGKRGEVLWIDASTRGECFAG